MSNWKTSAAGIGAILVAVGTVAVGLANGTPIDWSACIAAVMAGIGLIAAKDAPKAGA
jgi:hypothetical protein